MNRTIKHEPADLVANVEAGVTLRQLQQELAKSGQWLPIDPPAGVESTLGGIVATAADGPGTFGFGPLRSFVIGMRVILADGRLIKAGGNVVKNVAGYDLCKLFSGSFGTLGFITEITFKLRPLPAETRTVVMSGRFGSILDVGRRIARELFPNCVELLSPGMPQNLVVNSADYGLLVRFGGSARGVISQTAQALKIGRDDSRNRCVAIDEDEELWQNLGVAASAEDDLIWHASLKPTDLHSFLPDISALENNGSHARLRWHAGLGDGRMRVIARAPVYHREAVRALERLRQRSQTSGGSLVVEKAPKEIKDEFDSWGDFGSKGELMQRIKSQLDPENIFSPGRIFA